MRYSALGKSGITASVIGMGTWVTGGGMIWGEDPDDAELLRASRQSSHNGVSPGGALTRVTRVDRITLRG